MPHAPSLPPLHLALALQVHVLVRASLLELVEVGLDETTVAGVLLRRVDDVLAWVARYMGPDAHAGVKLGGAHLAKSGTCACAGACVCMWGEARRVGRAYPPVCAFALHVIRVCVCLACMRLFQTSCLVAR